MRYCTVRFYKEKNMMSRTYTYKVPNYITDEELKNAKNVVVENAFSGSPYKVARVVNISSKFFAWGEEKPTKFIVSVVPHSRYENFVQEEEETKNFQKKAEDWVHNLTPEQMTELYKKTVVTPTSSQENTKKPYMNFNASHHKTPKNEVSFTFNGTPITLSPEEEASLKEMTKTLFSL